MEEWKYNECKFECDSINYELLRYSPWSGHRNFAYDYVTYSKPENIVELGSYYGCSTFAFMQAIKDENLDTKVYAIDTWAGDDFTKTDYKENVYLAFSDIANSCFKNNNLIMLRKTFDEAVEEFEDKSIELLHIDGSHHYEDVKHDFETWISKVKDDGVVFFHDISSDKMYGEIMGSHYFWEEIKQKFNYTVEFDFSYGLGILFLTKQKYDEFLNIVDMSRYQRINNSLTVEYKDELRKRYFEVNDKNFYINSLKEQLDIKDSHLNKYSLDMNQKDEYINQLKNDIMCWKENVEGKDKYITELEANISNLNKGIDDYAQNVQGKDNYIKELEAKVKELNESINAKKSKIENLEQEVANTVKRLEKEINKSVLKKIFKK